MTTGVFQSILLGSLYKSTGFILYSELLLDELLSQELLSDLTVSQTQAQKGLHWFG